MRKLMFLMVALLVAPAMATVTISLVDNGDCTVDLIATADGADTVGGADVKSLVAGLALNVSVGAGEEITSITNFMSTGVSVAGATGYGIYMGNITFTVVDPGGPNEETVIDDVGSPVAPASAPDSPGQLPGESCVLEFAALFDVGVPADAPDAVTVLATITLAADATVSVSEEGATRGGIVNIGGAAPSGGVVMPDPLEVICDGPDCWDFPCFGLGDADGDGFITSADITFLVNSWTVYNKCADFDKDGFITSADITILVNNWTDGCP